MEENQPKLIILLDLAQELITVAQIPLYGNKHSRKDFNNHILFKLLVLKEYLGEDYRRFCDRLEVTNIPQYLGVKRIPHFTTLQKFAQRQNLQKLEKILASFVEIAPKKMKNVGVDSSYFRSSYASEHYETRINRSIKKKDFLKCNFFFDLDNLMILAIKMRKSKRHDAHDMKPLWNKADKFIFKSFYGDKAYDANWLHKLIFESGRKSMIHIKLEDLPIWRTGGTFRKQAKRLAKNDEKGKRSLVETGISVIKRVFDSVMHARTLTSQKVELIFRIIAFNVERIYLLTKNIFWAFLFFLDFLSKLKKIGREDRVFSIQSC